MPVGVKIIPFPHSPEPKTQENGQSEEKRTSCPTMNTANHTCSYLDSGQQTTASAQIKRHHGAGSTARLAGSTGRDGVVCFH